MPEQDPPAGPAVAMLRDLTEAAAEVAGCLLGLPPEDATAGQGPPGKRT